LSIDTFFTAIKDGTWHNINELSNQLATSTTKLSELSNFLADYGLIKYEKNNQTIKIQRLWKLTLPKEEETKKTSPNIANLIISPHSSINVQSTKISNLSNIEIEVIIRVDDQIREIAIDV